MFSLFMFALNDEDDELLAALDDINLNDSFILLSSIVLHSLFNSLVLLELEVVVVLVLLIEEVSDVFGFRCGGIAIIFNIYTFI